MNALIHLYKIIKMKNFNRHNHTRLRSIYANLRAKYGFDVRVDANTYIADSVSIGDYSYVNNNSRLQNCEVGKFCSISSNVNINPYNHNLEGITTHPIGDYKREMKRVTIGNDVLISLNVTILEGVHIGNGAVVGAGAVVTHDVGDYEIWGGVPAKFIRYRVSDEKLREKLLLLKWWDMAEEERNRYINNNREHINAI